MNKPLPFKYNDGGRALAGYKNHTGDCVARAISIAFNKNYIEVYELINKMSSNERTGKRKKRKSSARTGVFPYTIKKVMRHLGGEWTSLMKIGTGCRYHLREGELPEKGKYVLSLSRHLTALVDGTIHDTHDCSRKGNGCVYGYWKVTK